MVVCCRCARNVLKVYRMQYLNRQLCSVCIKQYCLQCFFLTKEYSVDMKDEPVPPLVDVKEMLLNNLHTALIQ